jgi:hypothetical protein
MTPDPTAALAALGSQFKAERRQFNDFVLAVEKLMAGIPSMQSLESRDGELQFAYLHASFRLCHTFRIPTGATAGPRKFESVAQLFSTDHAFLSDAGAPAGQPRSVVFDREGNVLNDGSPTGQTLRTHAAQIFEALLLGAG